MEAAAENGVSVLVLDRPNPNGYFVDGPVLDLKYRSFVGMHPVPVVHGMTIGEYARMVNGEGWLANGVVCDLTVVPMSGYTHNTHYSLPVAPSPNLQTDEAIYLYPSLCLFEGTAISVGRGTPTPFQIYGHPSLKAGDFHFTPKPIKGVSENPPQKGLDCRGYDLSPPTVRARKAVAPTSGRDRLFPTSISPNFRRAATPSGPASGRPSPPTTTTRLSIPV